LATGGIDQDGSLDFAVGAHRADGGPYGLHDAGAIWLYSGASLLSDATFSAL
jgi:hypothetical protein